MCVCVFVRGAGGLKLALSEGKGQTHLGCPPPTHTHTHFGIDSGALGSMFFCVEQKRLLGWFGWFGGSSKGRGSFFRGTINISVLIDIVATVMFCVTQICTTLFAVLLEQLWAGGEGERGGGGCGHSALPPPRLLLIAAPSGGTQPNWDLFVITDSPDWEVNIPAP